MGLTCNGYLCSFCTLFPAATSNQCCQFNMQGKLCDYNFPPLSKMGKGNWVFHMHTRVCSIEDCKEASKEMRKVFNKTDSIEVPEGCFLRYDQVYWNIAELGSRHPNIQAICNNNGMYFGRDFISGL